MNRKVNMSHQYLLEILRIIITNSQSNCRLMLAMNSNCNKTINPHEGTKGTTFYFVLSIYNKGNCYELDAFFSNPLLFIIIATDHHLCIFQCYIKSTTNNKIKNKYYCSKNMNFYGFVNFAKTDLYVLI